MALQGRWPRHTQKNAPVQHGVSMRQASALTWSSGGSWCLRLAAWNLPSKSPYVGAWMASLGATALPVPNPGTDCLPEAERNPRCPALKFPRETPEVLLTGASPKRKRANCPVESMTALEGRESTKN
jgi:hypothetical protein